MIIKIITAKIKRINTGEFCSKNKNGTPIISKTKAATIIPFVSNPERWHPGQSPLLQNPGFP